MSRQDDDQPRLDLLGQPAQARSLPGINPSIHQATYPPADHSAIPLFHSSGAPLKLLPMISTVEQHILEQQRNFPHATGEFSWLLSGITLATKIIQAQVQRRSFCNTQLPATRLHQLTRQTR